MATNRPELTQSEKEFIELCVQRDPTKSSRNIMDRINSLRGIKGVDFITHTMFIDELRRGGAKDIATGRGYKAPRDRKTESVYTPTEVKETPKVEPAVEETKVETEQVKETVTLEDSGLNGDTPFVQILSWIISGKEPIVHDIMKTLHYGRNTVKMVLDKLVEEGILSLEGDKRKMYKLLVDTKFLLEYYNSFPKAEVKNEPEQKKPEVKNDVDIDKFRANYKALAEMMQRTSGNKRISIQMVMEYFRFSYFDTIWLLATMDARGVGQFNKNVGWMYYDRDRINAEVKKLIEGEKVDPVVMDIVTDNDVETAKKEVKETPKEEVKQPEPPVVEEVKETPKEEVKLPETKPEPVVEEVKETPKEEKKHTLVLTFPIGGVRTEIRLVIEKDTRIDMCYTKDGVLYADIS